jgi:hypothetical protein
MLPHPVLMRLIEEKVGKREGMPPPEREKAVLCGAAVRVVCVLVAGTGFDRCRTRVSLIRPTTAKVATTAIANHDRKVR